MSLFIIKIIIFLKKEKLKIFKMEPPGMNVNVMYYFYFARQEENIRKIQFEKKNQKKKYDIQLR